MCQIDILHRIQFTIRVHVLGLFPAYVAKLKVLPRFELPWNAGKFRSEGGFSTQYFNTMEHIECSLCLPDQYVLSNLSEWPQRIMPAALIAGNAAGTSQGMRRYCSALNTMPPPCESICMIS